MQKRKVSNSFRSMRAERDALLRRLETTKPSEPSHDLLVQTHQLLLRTDSKAQAAIILLRNLQVEVQEFRKEAQEDRQRYLAVLRLLLLQTNSPDESEAVLKDFGFEKTTTVKDTPR